MAKRTPDLWTAVERLVDASASLADLRAHRLHLLAGRRWRAVGRVVPDELKLDERRSVTGALAAPALLRRIREACDGPLLVLKGPEVAARYPDPVLRSYGDLDLLVENPSEVQRALLAAGFVAVGNPQLYEGIHHERPLAVHGLPLHVELHSVPKWPAECAPPPVAELFEAALPSSLGVAGVHTLDPAHHALVLVAHSWAHSPLRRVGDLVDIAAMAQGVDPADLHAVAVRWGLRRIWSTTAGATGALFEGGRVTWPLRTWAAHLPAVRDRTVLESHLERWLSRFWALRADVAAGGLGGVLVGELAPSRGETLAAKLSRTRLALANARVARSLHVEQVEQAGIRAPLFYELGRRADDRLDEHGAAERPRRSQSAS